MNRARNRTNASGTRAERVLVLAGLAVTLSATPAMLLLSVPAPVIGFVWVLAILWTVFASLGRALWVLAHGDPSGFGVPVDAHERAGQDTRDWSAQTGAYAHLRIRARDEALVRDGDRYLKDHDHACSRN